MWRFEAPTLEKSVPEARHAVRDVLTQQGVSRDDTALGDLLVILSELVTNAVRHAALLSPQITVEVALDERWMRVAVRDSHPYRPRALQVDSEGTGGRGLQLVKTLTQDAGGECDVQRCADGGKTIWATLPRDGSAASARP